MLQDCGSSCGNLVSWENSVLVMPNALVDATSSYKRTPKSTQVSKRRASYWRILGTPYGAHKLRSNTALPPVVHTAETFVHACLCVPQTTEMICTGLDLEVAMKETRNDLLISKQYGDIVPNQVSEVHDRERERRARVFPSFTQPSPFVHTCV